MKIDSKAGAVRRSPRPDLSKPSKLTQEKLPDPSSCPKCGVSYRKGRWTWTEAPPEAARVKCPACCRVEAKQAGGEVLLTGPFLASHRTEVLNLVMARESRAKHDFPMQRIIEVEKQPDGVRITTTDCHLARTIAVAVHEACKGELDLTYLKDENFVRAVWSR